MIVVAYYTIGTPYRQEAGHLLASIEGHFDGPVMLMAFEHPGSWGLATCLNTQAIIAARRAYPQEVIVYVDADALIRGSLDEADVWAKAGYDVGLYYHKSPGRSPDDSGLELCTGTTVWMPTIPANELLLAWDQVNQRPETAGLRGADQEALQLLVNQRRALRVMQLPHEWCWMDTISEMVYGPHVPVVYHTQASRRHKAKVSR